MGYLSYRAPGHDDIADLLALDQLALGGLWSAEAYGREIDSPNSCLLMLVHLSHGSHEDQVNPSTALMAKPQLCSGEAVARGVTSSLGGSNQASAGSALLGLGCYWAILDEAHITVLAIDPRYQRRGLGQWLLANLLLDACGGQRVEQTGDRALARATLEVRPSNSRAIALYESFGFESLGRRRRYYADGEDALILWQNSLKTPDFRNQLVGRRQASHHRLERQGWQIVDPKTSLNRT
ncbi:MAG: GNAT family N-acetyltransferase [Nodosilinea sp.]